MKNHYNLITIGSGPAGLAVSFYIKDSIPEQLRSKKFTTCILDKTKYPSGGLINDGKMNLTPYIGFDDFTDGRINLEEAWLNINYFDQIILRHGANPEVTGLDEQVIKYWKNKLEPYDLELIEETKQRHIGTDRSKALINSMRKELEESGIEFRLGEEVTQINKNKNGFELLVSKDGDNYTLTCNYLLIAPGRMGTQWFRHQLDQLNVDYKQLPVEVGVRVEMLYEDYPIAHEIRDPKIKMKNPTNGDRIKTFCTNPKGKIRLDMPEQAIYYKQHKLIMINGDGLRDENAQTSNTNFAILNKISLVDPEQDTEQYAIDLAIKTFRVGGWKPIVQRLEKFLDYRRSKLSDFTGRERVQPTIPIGAITPGDINIVYPARIVNNIKTILERLSKEMPNVIHPENLIYASEMKFQNIRVEVTNYLETNVKNLFVAGNGAGLSSGIVGAASNGILAAKGILEKL